MRAFESLQWAPTLTAFDVDRDWTRGAQFRDHPFMLSAGRGL